MKKVKIVFFIDSLVRGGAQRQLVELALAIDKNLFSPVFLVYHDIQQLRCYLDDTGIPVVLIKKSVRFDPVFLLRLFIFFRKERPDIIQSYLNTTNFLARIIGRLAGVKRIFTSERNLDIQYSKFRILLERISYRASRCIVVNAEAIRQLLIDRLGIPAGMIKVIYNGVDAAKFASAAVDDIAALRTTHGIAPGDFVLTLPGRLILEKNHECLVRAVAELKTAAKPIKVLFVGNELDVALKQRLIDLIAGQKLTDSVLLLGRQENMAAIYALSTVVVLPSLWEGFPNVVLEAMAAGRPVIASDIADNSRLVRSDITGYLFRSNDHLDLARVLQNVLSMSQDEIGRLGEAGRRLVQEEYTVEKMANSYQDMYLSAMRDHESRG